MKDVVRLILPWRGKRVKSEMIDIKASNESLNNQSYNYKRQI